jgi:copper chaperone CopZ
VRCYPSRCRLDAPVRRQSRPRVDHCSQVSFEGTFIVGCDARLFTVMSRGMLNMDRTVTSGARTVKAYFSIGGMSCASCVRLVESTVRAQLPGIQSVNVALLTESGEVVFDMGATNEAAIESVINDLGESGVLKGYSRFSLSHAV